MTACYRRELSLICDNDLCEHGRTGGTAEAYFDDLDCKGTVTPAKLRAVARYFGWVFKGRKCYCKKCSEACAAQARGGATT